MQALMVYSVVMQSSSSQPPTDHTKPQQPLLPVVPGAMSRVKQLLAALQMVSQKVELRPAFSSMMAASTQSACMLLLGTCSNLAILCLHLHVQDC